MKLKTTWPENQGKKKMHGNPKSIHIYPHHIALNWVAFVAKHADHVVPCAWDVHAPADPTLRGESHPIPSPQELLAMTKRTRRGVFTGILRPCTLHPRIHVELMPTTRNNEKVTVIAHNFLFQHSFNCSNQEAMIIKKHRNV